MLLSKWIYYGSFGVTGSWSWSSNKLVLLVVVLVAELCFREVWVTRWIYSWMDFYRVRTHTSARPPNCSTAVNSSVSFTDLLPSRLIRLKTIFSICSCPFSSFAKVDLHGSKKIQSNIILVQHLMTHLADDLCWHWMIRYTWLYHDESKFLEAFYAAQSMAPVHGRSIRIYSPSLYDCMVTYIG